MLSLTHEQFGKGHRACPGLELSMLELRILVTEILWKINIEWASQNPQVVIKMYFGSLIDLSDSTV